MDLAGGAAWLSGSQGKVVMAPNKWFDLEKNNMPVQFLEAIEGHDSGIAVPSDWIKIPV